MINNYLERQIKENFPYELTFEQNKTVELLSVFLLSGKNAPSKAGLLHVEFKLTSVSLANGAK